MFLMVLGDSRLRVARLSVLNELTVTISRAQNHGPMMQSALEKLKVVAKAKTAWFRMIEGSQLVLTQHVGLSPDFVRAIGQIDMDDALARVLKDNRAAVLKPSESPEPVREQLKKQGIHHVVVLPVQGKKSVIGTLSLGCSSGRGHSAEELEFLETVTHQLGIAVENLRLLEQVLRSQRQWMNTFDSIQDLILAHDGDFRILKTNQALLQRLEQAPADVVGNPCEMVLPQHSPWSGCPYCDRGAGLTEGPDPCFGGQSLVSTSSFTEQGSQQKGTIHVVRDTTDRHVAEEKYRMLFEQAQEGVFVATLEGKLLD
jgi:two-component system NtrC family sensor kinase